MKWGVRRYQNPDGTLTKAGERRYHPDIVNARQNLKTARKEIKKTKIEYNKVSVGGIRRNKKSKNALKKLNSAEWEEKFAKEDLADAKAKVKMDQQTKKSKRQASLEQKYIDNGMPPDEAKLQAYKRARTEKIIKITAGVAVASAAAYVAYKHYDKNVDKIIKSGKTLQNISTDKNKGVADAFYSSMNKLDNSKYQGMFGGDLKRNSQLFNGGKDSVYKTTIGVGPNGLKLASQKSATKVLDDLVKTDPEYKKFLRDSIAELKFAGSPPKTRGTLIKAIDALDKGEVNNKVYDAMNMTLVNHSPSGQKAADKFYDAMKKKGYDAIKDINDSKYSGYKSINPVIVFNGKEKVSVLNSKKVSDSDIKKSALIGKAHMLGLDVGIKTGMYAGTVSAIGGANKLVTSKQNSKIVRQYRKEHPNSKLSDKEIVRNYRRENV